MKVSNIMTKKVYSVKPDDHIIKVATLICVKKVSGICILDDNDKLIGIISEKDILKVMYPTYEEFSEDPVQYVDLEAMEERYESVSHKKVKDVMSKHVITSTPDIPILKLASIMIQKRIRRVPIVEGDNLVGIVSQGDIHQAIFINKCSIAQS